MPYKDIEKQKAAQKAHYEANKGKYKDSSRAARIRRFAKLMELKDKPCMDCGIKYPPYVMEYDHISNDKLDSIANLLQKASWQRILDEIAKCELVCANCHRIRTYKRLQDSGNGCMMKI